MKIFKTVLTVSGFTFLSRIMGLLREILLAHFCGVSAVTDVFVVAFKLPNFFRRIFAEGAFNAAFVPLFSGKLATEGKEEAHRFAEQVFAVLFYFLLGFVAFVLIFTPSIIHILAPGFSNRPEQVEMAITFTRITFPYILFISLAAQLSGILNSLDRFAAAAGVPILLNICMILALLTAPSWGLSYGVALCCSVSIAGVAQLAWLYVACRRLNFPLKLRFPRLTADVRKVAKLMVPGAIGAGFTNISFLIDTQIASFLPTKSITYVFFADRLNQLPLALFGIGIGTALLPVLSRQLKAGNHQKAHEQKIFATDLAFQVTIPAAVGLFVLSYPLIHLIYRTLSIGDAWAIAYALQGFAIGIPAYVLNKIFITGFFARQDTKTPVKVASCCILINVITCLSLMNWLGHVALALAVSISSWANTLILYVILKKRGWFSFNHDLIKKCRIICFNSFFMGLVLWQLNNLFLGFADTLLTSLTHVLLSTVLGVLIIVTLGVFFKTLNLLEFKKALGASSSAKK